MRCILLRRGEGHFFARLSRKATKSARAAYHDEPCLSFPIRGKPRLGVEDISLSFRSCASGMKSARGRQRTFTDWHPNWPTTKDFVRLFALFPVRWRNVKK